MKRWSPHICAVLILCLAVTPAIAGISKPASQTEIKADSTDQNMIPSNAEPSGNGQYFDPDFLRLLSSIPDGFFRVKLKNGEEYVARINIHPDRLYIWTGMKSNGFSVAFEEIESIQASPETPKEITPKLHKKSKKSLLITVPLVLFGLLLVVAIADD